MTFYQSLATVLLRVWAATLLVVAVQSFIQIGIGWISQPPSPDDPYRPWLLGSLASYAVSVCIGIALWFFARPLGKRIGGGFSAPATGIEVDGERLIQIGAFLIGLFYLVEYGPRGIADLAAISIEIAKESDGERLTGGHRIYFPGWQQFVQNWAVIAIALLIALRARDFAKLFSWLRQAGQYREKSEAGGGAGKSVAGE